MDDWIIRVALIVCRKVLSSSSETCFLNCQKIACMGSRTSSKCRINRTLFHHVFRSHQPRSKCCSAEARSYFGNVESGQESLCNQAQIDEAVCALVGRFFSLLYRHKLHKSIISAVQTLASILGSALTYWSVLISGLWAALQNQKKETAKPLLFRS